MEGWIDWLGKYYDFILSAVLTLTFLILLATNRFFRAFVEAFFEAFWRTFRVIVEAIFRLFLLDADVVGISRVERSPSYAELRRRVRLLEREIGTQPIEVRTQAINEEVRRFLDQNLASILREKLSDSTNIERAVLDNLHSTVIGRVDALLEKEPASKLIESDLERQLASEAIGLRSKLEESLEQERRSASRLKAVMINLFVLFNLGILSLHLFTGKTLEPYVSYTITGLYLSLVAFIFYIVRASHFRSAVLLAIRENFVNQNQVMNYVRTLSRSGGPTDVDVEIIRLLMTNRTEREQKAEHPYEVLLKGVSGSNIQFKGGKMTIGTPKKGDAG